MKNLADEIKQMEKKFSKPGLGTKQQISIQSHIARLQNYGTGESTEQVYQVTGKPKAAGTVEKLQRDRDVSKGKDPQTHGCIS